MYGTWPDPAPCWGDKKGGFYCRELSWAWLVREYVARCHFRYSELLEDAKVFVREMGRPPPTDLRGDLAMLIAWDARLKRRRRDEQRWRIGAAKREDQLTQMNEIALARAKTLLLNGLCPVCGETLPCVPCGVPEVVLDGKGGLIAAYEMKARTA